MRLYHVTTDVTSSVVKTFYPRVSQSASDIEDKTTGRVCLSTSIEKCIQSAYGYLQPGAVIRVYQYDLRKYDVLHIIPPYVLWKTGMVFDAMYNEEVWYTQKLTMQSTLQRIVASYTEHVLDFYSIDRLALVSLIKNRYDLSINGRSAQRVYESALQTLLKQKRYDEYDDLSDIVAETFPCKQIAITELLLEEVPESYKSRLTFDSGVYYYKTN